MIRILRIRLVKHNMFLKNGNQTNNGSSITNSWDIYTGFNKIQKENNVKLVISEGTWLLNKRLKVFKN